MRDIKKMSGDAFLCCGLNGRVMDIDVSKSSSIMVKSRTSERRVVDKGEKCRRQGRKALGGRAGQWVGAKLITLWTVSALGIHNSQVAGN